MATGNETPWAVPLIGRDRTEAHRAATPLELLFDLSFVVAVAAAAANLHHGLAEAHWSNLGGYLAVFFAIWWAWMNYTWFASAYDTNDVLFRVMTLVQMAGVLVLAAGVPRALNEGDYTVVVIGYVIMRLAMVAFWARAARGDTTRRTTCLTYAVGIAVVQLLWIVRILAHAWGGVGTFALLVVAELLVPLLAERPGRTTPWHPGHIVERYGLMTIIVLGEVLLSTTGAISAALDEHGITPSLTAIVVGGLLVVFCMWWFYFKHSYEERLATEESENPFVWGYGHYVIYASAAAVGAGLGVCIDVVEQSAQVASRPAAMTLGVPVACYLTTLGVLHAKDAGNPTTLVRALLTSAAVLALTAVGWEVGLTVLLVGAVLVVALVEYLVVDRDARAQHDNKRRAARGHSVENMHG
ncbi:MAG: low temperature requirement protein A [Dermatophilaceae bacterium]